MPKYIDEEGNEIELQVPLADLQAAAADKEKLAKDLDEARKQVADLGNKDLNWKRLRNMSKEETDKLSSREREIMERQEALEEKTKQFQSNQVDSFKKNALSRFGAVDEETKAKILSQYERIKDDASTEEEITVKMRDAFTLATGSAPSSRANPMGAVNFMGGAPTPARNSELTGELVSLASKLGITKEDFDKFYKK